MDGSAYYIELRTRNLKSILCIRLHLTFCKGIFFLFNNHFLKTGVKCPFILLCTVNKFKVILLYKQIFTVIENKHLRMDACLCSLHQFAHGNTQLIHVFMLTVTTVRHRSHRPEPSRNLTPRKQEMLKCFLDELDSVCTTLARPSNGFRLLNPCISTIRYSYRRLNLLLF